MTKYGIKVEYARVLTLEIFGVLNGVAIKGNHLKDFTQVDAEPVRRPPEGTRSGLECPQC